MPPAPLARHGVMAWLRRYRSPPPPRPLGRVVHTSYLVQGAPRWGTQQLPTISRPSRATLAACTAPTGAQTLGSSRQVVQTARSGECACMHVPSGRRHRALLAWACAEALWLLTCCDTCLHRLWELQTIHNPLRLFGGSGKAHGGAPVVSAKFSFTGDRLLSMGRDQVVRLWNFEGDCVAKWVQTDVRATAVAMDVRGEMVRCSIIVVCSKHPCLRLAAVALWLRPLTCVVALRRGAAADRGRFQTRRRATRPGYGRHFQRCTAVRDDNPGVLRRQVRCRFRIMMPWGCAQHVLHAHPSPAADPTRHCSPCGSLAQAHVAPKPDRIVPVLRDTLRTQQRQRDHRNHSTAQHRRVRALPPILLRPTPALPVLSMQADHEAEPVCGGEPIPTLEGRRGAHRGARCTSRGQAQATRQPCAQWRWRHAHPGAHQAGTRTRAHKSSARPTAW